MILKPRIPIRFKLIAVVLLVVTAVVGMITFTTAGLFQKDKRAYVNGLTSMVALGTAEETRSVLDGYAERLRLYARLLREQATSDVEREALSKALFEEFEELIALEIDDGYEEPVAVYNVSQLESAGLTREDLGAFERANPLPRERISPERPHVRNSTISARLPCFTLALEVELDEAGPILVKATLGSDRLIALTSRFSAYEQYLVDSDGRVLAHPRPSLIVERRPVEQRDELQAVRDQFNAGVTTEYERFGERVIAGLAGADFGNVAAVAEIPVSAASLAARQLLQRLLVLAAVLLTLSIALAIFWAHRLTGPMERLSRATQAIGRGAFDIEVKVDARDEVGDLATSFNQMAGELKLRESKLTEAHRQLVHSEKMAAFGQLGAGIAHEVKNPLTGILACAQLAGEELGPESPVHEDLKLIEKETLRCKSIIENLMRFARQEKTQFGPVEVNNVIRDSVAIVNHQLELSQVTVERELNEDLPPVRGDANQLQQVFVNLMINAQQAMAGKPGSVRITSSVAPDGEIELCFTDTGPGIPEEIREKLFEPFFTTKPAGEGTGLGLSVTYGIIQDHRGHIDIESEPGQGSTFRIVLPACEGGSAPSGSEVELVTET